MIKEQIDLSKNKKKIKYYSWVTLGSAFLMSELHAAYLFPQLKIFKSIIQKRKKLYERELDSKSWEQPIIEEAKFGSGLIGMIIKKKSNKNFFLIQAKFEPGNIYKLQISPTVQSTFSNIKYNSGKTKFLKYFQNNLSKKRTILKKWVSEDGGRFFKKKNLIHIIKISDKVKIKLPENYIWIDEKNLFKLNLFEKPIVNCHVRSILSFTNYLKKY